MLTLAHEKIHREFIRVRPGTTQFIGANTHRRFRPIGFNYDHDEHYRLIEAYWHDEWQKVVNDFKTMAGRGINTVRIHLQLDKFVDAPDKANEKNLDRLGDLIHLAGSEGLYLDLVGLGCYHEYEVPNWYTHMHYRERWDVQAFFWQSIAQRYHNEPAIFCFDLMNEPIIPARKRPAGAWLGKDFMGKTYVQFVVLEVENSTRKKIAKEWLQHLIDAIRVYDISHMITVGLVDWSVEGASKKSGFFPSELVHQLDFISCHLYPFSGKLDEINQTLNGFCVGKPVVIDETFHFTSTVEEHAQFLKAAEDKIEGFMTFFTDLFPPAQDDGRWEMLMKNYAVHDLVEPLYKNT